MVLPQAPNASADEVEQQFYDALQRADIDKLMALWADDDDIACVHPGGARLVGPGPIRAGFEALFSNGPVQVHASHVRRLMDGSTAIHSVLERVLVNSSDGVQTAWVLATNVYLKTAAGWRLALHHASPGSPGEVQEISESPAVLH